jgi:hypothetical protein
MENGIQRGRGRRTAPRTVGEIAPGETVLRREGFQAEDEPKTGQDKGGQENDLRPADEEDFFDDCPSGCFYNGKPRPEDSLPQRSGGRALSRSVFYIFFRAIIHKNMNNLTDL